MTIETIIKRKGRSVETVALTETIKNAASRMQYHGIAALVAVDRREIRGVLTENDIVCAIARYGEAALPMTVAHILKPNMITIAPQDTVKRAMDLMTNNRVRHLPVMERGELVGIVSLGDVVKYRLDDLELEANVLRDVHIAMR